MILTASSPREVQEQLRDVGYVADTEIATAVFLATILEKPLLVEGQPGSGKTELAKALTQMTNRDLVRLQCYRGLNAENTLYEWDYMKQFLRIRIAGELNSTLDPDDVEASIFDEEYLLERPISTALRNGESSVLLVDEIDRANEEFEAFLLEVLDEFQITIPEYGSIVADEPPFVVITSNRTRQISNAIKRRCLYLHVKPPVFERELEIIHERVPELDESLAVDLVELIQAIRETGDLLRTPGVAETIDWARAFHGLDAEELTPETVEQTLSTVLKEPQDLEQFDDDDIERLVEQSRGD